MHILSPVTLPESAEGETKVSGWTGYRTSDLWLLSQTLSLLVYAKFQYSLNVLFCEPIEICEYKRKLYMYRVPEFRTMLTRGWSGGAMVLGKLPVPGPPAYLD